MGVLQGGVTTTEVVVDETAIGSINGSNKVFTTTDDYIAASLTVFLNGIQQAKPGDYSETSINSFTFVNAPLSIGSSDTVTIRYVRVPT